MTNEKQFEHICAMLKEYDAATGNGAAGSVISRPWEWEGNTVFPFYAHAAEMLIDCKAAMDKKTTSSGTLSALKRIVKSAMASLNPALSGMFENAGKWCICDGYRMIRLTADVDSLPHIDTKRYMPVDAEKIMKPAEQTCTTEIDLPPVSEVKAYIAKCKGLYGSKEKIAFEMVPGIYVNPHFLLDALQALPECRAYVDTNKGGKSMIYFVSETGDGVLLPVNPATARTA